MMELALSFEGKTLPIKHIPGPEGVRGRNSNNDLIKEKLGWAPSIKLADGLKARAAATRPTGERGVAPGSRSRLGARAPLRARTTAAHGR